MADEQHTVKRASDGRTLFRGTLEAAKEYVANNFPRRHAEPGNDYGDDGPAPDVVVHAPDGAMHALSAPGDWVSTMDAAPVTEPDTETEGE